MRHFNEFKDILPSSTHRKRPVKPIVDAMGSVEDGVLVDDDSAACVAESLIKIESFRRRFLPHPQTPVVSLRTLSDT